MNRTYSKPTRSEESAGYRTSTEVVEKNRRLLADADAALYASMGIDAPAAPAAAPGRFTVTQKHAGKPVLPIPGFSAYRIARDGTVYGANGSLRPRMDGKQLSVQMRGDDGRYTSRAVAALVREVWGHG